MNTYNIVFNVAGLARTRTVRAESHGEAWEKAEEIANSFETNDWPCDIIISVKEVME